MPPHSSSSFSTLIPSAPNPTIASSRANLSQAEALNRLEQTCLRLRWKSIDLQNSWARTSPEVAASHAFDVRVAERNFKLDFYEFYTWIEQAVVLLQRIFGVEIMAGGGGGMHAYHHNVLTALSDAENPLHGVLGGGDVNQALWKAKELRNRWKDAAGGDATTPSMRMYDLHWILVQILNGLEEAYSLARERVYAEGTGVTHETQEGGWDWMVEEAMDWEA